jgi:nucleoside-diphosphate-sugar epimerase
MKIVITGGAGYIGSVLTACFLKEGHEVAVIDILRRGSDGIIQHKDNPLFTLYNIEFSSPLVQDIIKDCNVVIHLAAIVGDKDCKENKELATKTNIEDVRSLIKYCNLTNVPLIVASTCSVYGTNPNVCSEKSIVFPLSHYADTKIKMEQLIKKHCNKFLIFRFGTMYGWSPNMRFDLVVNLLVENALKYGKFKVYGGKQYRPFLHPKDLALFLQKLFTLKRIQYNKIYNLVSENLMINELGELIETVIPTSKMEVVKESEVERSYLCRSYKVYKELGFSPQIRIRDGINEIRKKLLKTDIEEILEL